MKSIKIDFICVSIDGRLDTPKMQSESTWEVQPTAFLEPVGDSSSHFPLKRVTTMGPTNRPCAMAIHCDPKKKKNVLKISRSFVLLRLEGNWTSRWRQLLFQPPMASHGNRQQLSMKFLKRNYVSWQLDDEEICVRGKPSGEEKRWNAAEVFWFL